MEKIDEMKFETEVATFAKFQKKVAKAMKEKEEDKDKDEENQQTILTASKTEIYEPDRIKLSGDISQILEVKELKMNMIVIMVLLSVSSFKFYMIDM